MSALRCQAPTRVPIVTGDLPVPNGLLIFDCSRHRPCAVPLKAFEIATILPGGLHDDASRLLAMRFSAGG